MKKKCYTPGITESEGAIDGEDETDVIIKRQ